MECSEKPIFHNYTRQELAQIRITAPEEAVRSLVKKHWDTLAKPLDGMGSFETITAQIGAILGTEQIDLRKKGVLIFCADNGIVEEGVSQTGQEVTWRWQSPWHGKDPPSARWRRASARRRSLWISE